MPRRTTHNAQRTTCRSWAGREPGFHASRNGQDSSERYTSIFTADPERCLWFAPIVLDLVETIEPITVRLSAIGVKWGYSYLGVSLSGNGLGGVETTAVTRFSYRPAWQQTSRGGPESCFLRF